MQHDLNTTEYINEYYKTIQYMTGKKMMEASVTFFSNTLSIEGITCAIRTNI